MSTFRAGAQWCVTTTGVTDFLCVSARVGDFALPNARANIVSERIGRKRAPRSASNGERKESFIEKLQTDDPRCEFRSSEAPIRFENIPRSRVSRRKICRRPRNQPQGWALWESKNARPLS